MPRLALVLSQPPSLDKCARAQGTNPAQTPLYTFSSSGSSSSSLSSSSAMPPKSPAKLQLQDRSSQ